MQPAAPPAGGGLLAGGPTSQLIRGLVERAASRGHYLIARLQDARRLSAVVTNGATEQARTSRVAGIGLHLFTDDGHCALGSTDRFDGIEAASLLDRTARAARTSASFGAQPDLAFLDAPPIRLAVPPAGRCSLASTPPGRAAALALELDAEARARHAGLSFRTALSLEEESWRVARSDGTDVSWTTRRLVASQAATASEPAGTFTCRAALSSPHFDALDEATVRRRLLARTALAAGRARALADATPFLPTGDVPLLIDYALAKGLAHEAFGHAAEADGFRSSVLARNGRFRSGERVARETVSIIDEPIRGDHADQPVSPNGEVRRRARIIDSGVLHEALTDLFSAGGDSGPSRGCDRAESFRSAPIPRMSNIRIEIEGAEPLPLPFEDMTPENVRELAGEAGLLDTYDRIAYLAGYTGGQVNPIQGDFIFNCQAIYSLTRRGVEIHRPSVFRGSILAALGSLSRGFGPLHLDAIGTCGKWGQSVPSCGGSHAFVFLEPDPSIGIGSR